MKNIKVQWIEEGEKCSSFFLNLQNKQLKETIHQLKEVNNSLATSSEDIIKIAKRYYENLYTKCKDSIIMQNILVNKLKKTLTPSQFTICDATISESEIYMAISDLNNGKAPGPDGIPAEFYKIFHPMMKTELLTLKKTIERFHTLSPSQKMQT